MSIKTWIIITISSLLIAVVLVLSLSFYNQFQDALDETVMLQLTSIKRLKRVQIEDYLNREWDIFIESDNDEKSIELTNSMTKALMSKKYQKAGMYDLTHLNPNGHLLITLIDQSNNKIKIIGHKNIQRILLERTGMGESGETYLGCQPVSRITNTEYFNISPVSGSTIECQRVSKMSHPVGVH
jgi:two-component system NarL family sensor kinase